MALISSLCIFVLVAHFATPIVCIRSPINQTPALFVFGDSIFDPGNNNYINTIASFQAKYLPYGESFFKDPTGRTSNGRLIPDLMAENANLPLIPPYFEIGKKQFTHGVNFASAGSGCLPETARGFGVYEEGGRKFAMLNLGPFGCLPSIRNLNLQKGVTNGSCMEDATNLAKMFNSALPEMLKQLEKQLPGFKYTIFNFFKVFADSIDNPTKYGFKISETACCGTGPFRGIFSCGGKRQVKEYELCKNVKDYLFFDSSHPSEQAYQKYTELLWNGTPDVVAPYNLKSFFKL